MVRGEPTCFMVPQSRYETCSAANTHFIPDSEMAGRNDVI